MNLELCFPNFSKSKIILSDSMKSADFIESESIILDLEKFGKHNSKFINKHNSSAYVKRVRG